jgi:hypothetical protein
VEFTGDGSQAVAAFDAFVDLPVALAGAGDRGPRTSVHVEFAQGSGEGVRLRAGVVLVGPDREGFTQFGAVSSDDALDGLGEVVQQMPGVGHLPGLWCTGAVVAEGAVAVAGDVPHLGVFAQSGGGGVRGAVREDVDGAVSVRVHEERCGGTTTAHGELVDAQIRDGLRQRYGECAKEGSRGSLQLVRDMRPHRLAPARPPGNLALSVSWAVRACVRCACRRVGSGFCSASVRRPQLPLPHTGRRVRRSSRTWRPATGRSARHRWS